MPPLLSRPRLLLLLLARVATHTVCVLLGKRRRRRGGLGRRQQREPHFFGGSENGKRVWASLFQIGGSLSLLLKRAHGKGGNIFCHFFALSLALVSPPFISKQKLPSLPPPFFSLSFCRKRRWKRKSAVRRKDIFSRWLISLGGREEIAFEIEVGQTWVWGRERKKERRKWKRRKPTLPLRHFFPFRRPPALRPEKNNHFLAWLLTAGAGGGSSIGSHMIDL